MTSHDNSLHGLREIIERDERMILATVFGSVATGRAQPGSDLDVAVLAARPLDTDDRQAMISQLATATGRPIDLVDLRTAGVLVTQKALNGRLLFCRDDRAYGELLSRMVTDAEDFLPYLQRLLRARRNAWIRS